jgi:hypothetical protein
METFTRYLLKKGRLEKIKVPKDVALKEIDEVLEEDKEFLEIMEKM